MTRQHRLAAIAAGGGVLFVAALAVGNMAAAGAALVTAALAVGLIDQGRQYAKRARRG